MNTLVNYHIKTSLEDDSGITEVVGDRINPIIAQTGTPEFPFIIYDVEVTGVDYDKSMVSSTVPTLEKVADHYVVTMHIVAKTHDAMLALGNMVRNVLECSRLQLPTATFTMDPMQVSSWTASFREDIAAYVGELTFVFDLVW